MGDATIPEAMWPDVTALCPGYRRLRRATHWRLMRVLRRWRQDPLPMFEDKKDIGARGGRRPLNDRHD
jgi:hypothetical protein